jgi:hypothetical protein
MKFIKEALVLKQYYTQLINYVTERRNNLCRYSEEFSNYLSEQMAVFVRVIRPLEGLCQHFSSFVMK